MSNSNHPSANDARHAGVPPYFRTSCRETSQTGDDDYYALGYTAARAVGYEHPVDLDMEEWAKEIDALNGLLRRDDEDGTLHWFMRYYPAMTKLIPPRRRKEFICGVRVAYDDGSVGF